MRIFRLSERPVPMIDFIDYILPGPNAPVFGFGQPWQERSRDFGQNQVQNTSPSSNSTIYEKIQFKKGQRVSFIDDGGSEKNGTIIEINNPLDFKVQLDDFSETSVNVKRNKVKKI